MCSNCSLLHKIVAKIYLFSSCGGLWAVLSSVTCTKCPQFITLLFWYLYPKGGPDVQTWAGIQEYRSHGAVNHGLQFSWEGSILLWLVFVNLGKEDFPAPSCVVYFIPGGQLPIHVNGDFYIWQPTPAAVCFLQTIMSSASSAMKRALPPWPSWMSVVCWRTD